MNPSIHINGQYTFKGINAVWMPHNKCSMKQFDEVLDLIGEIVQDYESGQYMSQEKLLEAHRVLSSNIYYLTQLQLEYRNQWQQHFYRWQLGSVADREREADEKVPEVYMCRKIIESARGVSIAMSMELKIMQGD